MYAYLVKVEAGANNNKYYEMKAEEGDTSFTVYWGRVGQSPQTATYNIQMWNRKLNEKLRKGYRDVTHIRAVEKESSNQPEDNLASTSPIIKSIFQYLLQATSKSVSENYMTPVKGVTQAMVDDAQGFINELVTYSIDGWYPHDFDRTLQKLFTVIPRRMSNVRDYLLNNGGEDAARKIIAAEQDTLDSLKGQIVVVGTTDQDEQRVSLFDRLGIVVSDISLQEINLIKEQLGEISNLYSQAVVLSNRYTQSRYDNYIVTRPDKTERMLWHGSRTQNWISLVEKGLLLNPAGAIRTGSMFGQGLYFAPKARKSLGYTSLENSYWANGRDSRGYMALFRVHIGKQQRFDSSQSWLNYRQVSQAGYDSVIGVAGRNLHNDEIIVYQECQCDIRYLVELKQETKK